MAVDQQRLIRCLNPESIAVVGGKEADRVVEQCLKLGFAGPIWAINPKRESMQGLPCFNSLAQLPGVPDVTFVAIPADPSIEIIRELNRLGAGGAICYSAGFREVGDDGVERHNKLLAAAATMPLFGPNCHGYINTLSGAALWPDKHGLTRNKSGVAIFSCSGNISINFTLQQRGLPLAWLVTVGNQAVVGIEQGIAAALDNDKITALGIHVEGLNNLPLFIELAQQARMQGIPMIALKSGKSAIGARITLSHTATMAGESGLYSALFARLGIGQVDTIEEFLEALKLVVVTGPLAGNRISSMSCSGGEASLIADLSAVRDLHFPKVEAGHKKRLQATLNEYVNVDNPLDYHTFIWGDRERLSATFSAMMSGKYDLTLLIIDIPHITGGDVDIEEWELAIQAFIDASKRTGSKAAVVSSMSETLTDSIRKTLLENGIAALQGMQQALAAIEAACNIGRAWRQSGPAPQIQERTTAPALEADQVYGLNEYQAKQMLQQSGIAVPASSLVSNQSEGARAANEIGYPLVLKAVTPELVHKTESNAVVLGIASAEQLKHEIERLLKISETLLVEEMVGDVVAELLLGVSYDEQFGHYLVVGFGGTLVELIGDREILLLPVCRDEVIAALKKLKTWQLLTGFRGRQLADVDKVIDTVLAIAKLVEQKRDDIVELEINPLMVKSKNKGVMAADVLLRMRS